MLLEQCIRRQYKCTGMCNKENTSWKFRDIIDPTSEIALLPSTAQPDCTECLYKYRNNNCTMALHAAPWLSERLSSSVTPNAAKMPLMRDAIVFCILHLTILFTEEHWRITHHMTTAGNWSTVSLFPFSHYRAIVRLVRKAFPQWNVMTALNDLGIANCVCRCGGRRCGVARGGGEGTGCTNAK